MKTCNCGNPACITCKAASLMKYTAHNVKSTLYLHARNAENNRNLIRELKKEKQLGDLINARIKAAYKKIAELSTEINKREPTAHLTEKSWLEWKELINRRESLEDEIHGADSIDTASMQRQIDALRLPINLNWN